MDIAIYACIIYCSICSVGGWSRPLIDQRGFKPERAYSGNNVIVKCVADTPGNFIWLKSKSEISSKWRDKYCKTGDFDDAAIEVVGNNSHFEIVEDAMKKSILTISKVDRNQTGVYTCIANNSFGCDSVGKYLDVVQKSKNEKVFNWSISYSNWNVGKCQKMIVEYESNFMLSNDSMMLIQTDDEDEIDEDEFKREYGCETSGFQGVCVISDINLLIDYDKDFTLMIFVKRKTSKLLLGTHTIPHIKYEDIRGPLNVSVVDVEKNSVDIMWYRPWIKKCVYSLYVFTYFEEEVCNLVNNSCTKNEKFKADDREVICYAENERKGKEIFDDNIYICRYPMKGLLPNMRYSFRLRYTLKYIEVKQTWSKWSNTLEFATRSERPQVSPSINCEGRKSSIYISWTLPPAKKRVTYKKFKVTTKQEKYDIFIKPNQKVYGITIKSTEEEFISVSVCASDDTCSPVDTKLCKAESKKERKVIIISSLIGVLCIIFLIFVFYLMYSRYIRWRQSRNSRSDTDMDLIQPRGTLSSANSVEG